MFCSVAERGLLAYSEFPPNQRFDYACSAQGASPLRTIDYFNNASILATTMSSAAVLNPPSGIITSA